MTAIVGSDGAGGTVAPALPPHELAPGFDELGVLAFTTTRDAGSFGTTSDEAVGVVTDRWWTLWAALAPGAPRLATARQVHGPHVILHRPLWEGWLRSDAADGHAALERGTAMAVTIADCVPVFIAHPSGAVALLHSGWRGTEARILEAALELFRSHRIAPVDLTIHLGPAICGACYEVSPDVHARLTGRTVAVPTPVDLRAIIADQARRAGVRRVTITDRCTRCDNDRYYSHRAGDRGRQLGVIVASR